MESSLDSTSADSSTTHTVPQLISNDSSNSAPSPKPKPRDFARISDETISDVCASDFHSNVTDDFHTKANVDNVSHTRTVSATERSTTSLKLKSKPVHDDPVTTDTHDTTDGGLLFDHKLQTVQTSLTAASNSVSHTNTAINDLPVKCVGDAQSNIDTTYSHVDKTNGTKHTLDAVSDHFVGVADIGWSPTHKLAANNEPANEQQKRLKGL